MRRILFLILMLVCAPSAAMAATYTAANCTLSAVQAALANATAHGDIVQIPACSGSDGQWNGTLFVNNKNITIKGAGRAATVITQNSLSVQTLISWSTTSNSNIARLADMTLTSVGTNSSGTSDTETALVYITGNTTSLVIENVRFAQVRRQSLIVNGPIGVIARNRFELYNFDVAVQIQHGTWLGVGTGYGDQSWATATTLGGAQSVIMEDNEIACFIDFYCPTNQSYRGGRVTVRFNTMTGTGQTYQHGIDTPGRPRGSRQHEYYRNRAVYTLSTSGASMFNARSGVGRVFDNSLTVSGSATSTNTVYDMQTQRGANVPTTSQVFTPWADCRVRTISQITCSGGVAEATVTGTTSHGLSVFATTEIQGSSVSAYNGVKTALTGAGLGTLASPNLGRSSVGTTFRFAATCGGTANNAGITMRAPWDGNTGTNGYACLDQVGRGVGALITGGDDYRTGLSSSPANQALEPIYIWSNTRNGVANAGAYVYNGGDHTIAQANREYYNLDTVNCPAGGGNCTAGVGRGTLAQRPASCTTGVGFWATDQGTWNTESSALHTAHDPSSVTHSLGEDGRLYVCVSTDTWALNYTPYDYPHPLLSGAVGNQSPTVTITAPSTNGIYDTSTTPLVTLAGTMGDSDGTVSSVGWVCAPSCGSGTATLGAGTWTVASIAVPADDVATITVTATDNAAATSSPAVLLVNHVTTATGETDSFDRDNFSTLGNNWTHIGSGTKYTIASNQAVGVASAFDAAKWNVSPSTADQCAQFVVKDVSVFVRSAAALVRINGTNNATLAWYGLNINGASNNSIMENVAGSGITVLQSLSETFTTDDVAKLCIEGTSLRAYKNDIPIGTPQIDTTLSDGEVGVWIYGAGAINNFQGGDFGGFGDTAPTVTITSPTSAGTHETTASLLTVSGTASDNGSVVSNAWATNQGGSGACSGTISPSCVDIPLVPNVITAITVTATDNNSNTGNDVLQVLSVPAPGTPLDTFNRVNWPGPGPNWTPLTGNVPTVENGFLLTAANDHHYLRWNAHDLPADQCATIKIVSGFNGVIVRMSADTGATRDLYRAFTNGLTDGSLVIVKEVNGEFAVLSDSPFGVTWGVNDLLTLCATGTSTTTLTAYRDPVIGDEFVIASVDDTDSPLESGDVGIYQYGVGAQSDDFSAEEFEPSEDVNPPVVVITAPTTQPTMNTNSPTLSAGGTCTDEMGGSGVNNVTWSTNHGGSGTASGTTSWTIASFSVPTGTPTVLSVVCHDIAGNDSTADQLTITRTNTARRVLRRGGR